MVSKPPQPLRPGAAPLLRPAPVFNPVEAVARVKAKLEKPGELPKALGILIYGRTKSSKTSMLATMPGRGLVIDVRRKEGGTNVLADHAERINVYPIHVWRELDDVLAYLRSGEDKYSWVALDTITGLLALAEEATVGRLQTIGGVPRKLEGAQWGVLGARIIRLLDALHELEMFSIVLAQEKRREVPDLGNVVQPDVIPMLLTPLTEPMSLIGRVSVENVGDAQAPILEYQMRVKSHPAYYTGLRVGLDQARQLPDVIKNPHLGQLIKWMYKRGDPPEAATIPLREGGLLFESTDSLPAASDDDDAE